MIVKIAESPKNKREVATLAKYITDAIGGKDPSTWQRTEDYILDKKNIGHRTGDIRVTNCLSDDPADATLEIMATQAKNTRSKKEKEMHIIVSFPHGEEEKLTKDIMHDIEDELIKSIGLSKHQRISAQHLDKDHFHIHILVNKIDPQTFNNITPYYPKNKLMEMAEKLEIKHNLKITNHNAYNRYKGVADDIEAHRGEKSLLSWIKDNVEDSLVSLINKDNTSWDDVHSLLAEYDLEIRPRGAGLVINARGEKKLSVKASDVNKSLSNNQLRTRLGNYTENTKKLTEVKTFYKPETTYSKSNELFDKFQEQKKANYEARKEEHQKLYEASQDYINKLLTWYEGQRQAIKKTSMLPGEKRLAYKTLSIQKKQDIATHKAKLKTNKEDVNNKYPTLTWDKYLMQLVQDGNMEALKILRARTRTEQTLASAVLTTTSIDEIKDVILKDHKKVISKNGAVNYYAKDGGQIQDLQFSIVVNNPTLGGTALGLVLAVQKYPNQKLKIKGSDDFKNQVIQLAVNNKLDVIFADKELEAKKQELLKSSSTDLNEKIINEFIKNSKDGNSLRYNILYQKPLTEHDTKSNNFTFIDIKELDNNIKVALLKSDNTMFIKQLNAKEFINVSGLKQGQKVMIDNNSIVKKGKTR